MRKYFFIILPAIFSLYSCLHRNTVPEPPLVKVWGFKPVYTLDSSVLEIKASAARPIDIPGKIYAKGNLVFQNDVGRGIHVFDNTDPSAMHAIGFINILGSSEISIRGNYLYTNSFTDLVVVDISDWQQVKEVSRVKQAFIQGQEVYRASYHEFLPPPEHGVWFECPNLFLSSAQILAGWVRDSIYNNNCFYQ